MSAERDGASPLIGLGLRAQKGGAVAVGIVVREGEPRAILSTVLPTHATEDRLSLEPYRIAYEMVHGGQGATPADAAAIVADGRGRQERHAEEALRDILRRLDRAEGAAVVAALLVNRAGWIADLLQHALSWPEHVPVAEGLAVRDALRAAVRRCRIESVELDEKSLGDRAAERLGLPAAQIDARLKSLGAAAGKPWRKEQKLACLAAWVAAAGWP